MKIKVKNPIISHLVVGWPNPPVTTITFESEAERRKFMKGLKNSVSKPAPPKVSNVGGDK